MPIDLVYEERRTILRHGKLPAFIEQVRSGDYAGLHQPGGDVLCVLGSLIGAPETEVIRFTAFEDVAAWESATRVYGSSPLVESETLRLLRPVAGRPLRVTPDEHRRDYYGYRRFHIDASDLAELVHDSENGVWPRVELQDARVLGLFAEIGDPSPLEVVLLTGYHSASHWEATRVWSGQPEDMPDEVWERSQKLRERRAEISRTQWVHFMRNIPFGPRPD